MYNTKEQAIARASKALVPEKDPTRYHGALNEGAAWAKTWIDGRLAGKFSAMVPFAAPAPDLIQQVSADLAAHFVLKESFAGGGESKTPTLAEDLFNRAELVLDRLLNGSMTLPNDQASGQSRGLYLGGRAPRLRTFYDAHMSDIAPDGRVIP